MKIHDIEGVRLPQKIRSQPGSVKEKGGFQEVMNQVINGNTPGEAKDPSANHVLFPETVIPVQSAQNVWPEGATDTSGQKAIGELEGALDLAGYYADKLADPDVNTEALEPLVTHLEERLQSLRLLEKEGTLDGTLKEIISDLNINLVTEIAKFRRGDYS